VQGSDACKLHVQVSLARAPGDYFTVLLCFWGALSIMPFATVRAFANPAVALPNGEGSETPSCRL
jgi:hypothetical protein